MMREIDAGDGLEGDGSKLDLLRELVRNCSVIPPGVSLIHSHVLWKFILSN